MKRSILIVLVLALVLAAGVYYSVKFAPRAIETVLPGKAAVYIKVSDIEKQADEFRSSKLWKNIKGIDIEMLMEKSGAKKEQIEGYKTAKSEITSFLGGLVIDKYFGKEIAVALYPAETGEASANPASNLASKVILVTRIKPETDFIDFISKILNKFEQKYEIAEENYKGNKITVVKLSDGVGLAYVRIKDLLVMGIGKEAVIPCCDVADKAVSSLSQDKDYVATMSRLPKGARNVIYGDMELLVSEFRKFIYAAVKPQEAAEAGPRQAFKNQIDKSLSMYAGFKTFAYAGYPGKILAEKTIMIIDRSKLHPFCADFYSIPSRKNKTLKFAPVNTIYYGWSSFAPKAYWEYFRSELEKDNDKAKQGRSFNDVLAEFEQKAGMSVDNDIIPALGDELGAFLIDINLDGLIPVPEFVFFTKVNKKKALDGLTGYFLKEGKVKLESEGYKGIDIKYMALPAGEDFQPAYCYIGDYLLVSLGRKPIKESIDTYKGASKPLFEDEDFKAVNHGLTEASNGMCFIKMAALLQKAEDICDWGLTWLTVMVEQQKKYRQILDTKLDSMTEEVAKDEAELGKLESDVKTLEKEMGDPDLQEADAAVKHDELEKLKEGLEAKQSEVDTKREYLKDLEAKDQCKSPLENVDVPLVKLYLEEAVYPILEGLQSLKAIGSRTTYGENAIQGEYFSRIVE
jgi:hypothetical protein